MRGRGWWVVVACSGVAAALACSSDPLASPEPGAIDQACYPNGTCNTGLTCVSKVCVDLGTPDATVDVSTDHAVSVQDPDTSTGPDTSKALDASAPDTADTATINGNVCPTSPNPHGCPDGGFDWNNAKTDDAGWTHPDGFLICDPDASDKAHACDFFDSGGVSPGSTEQCTLGAPSRCPSGWACIWGDLPPDGGGTVIRQAVCP